MVESDRVPSAHEASQEKPHGADPDSSDYIAQHTITHPLDTNKSTND
jgi:hypothetical protein